MTSVVALAPGVVVADERDEATTTKLEQAGIEVHRSQAQQAPHGTRRRPLHDVPDLPRRVTGEQSKMEAVTTT